MSSGRWVQPLDLLVLGNDAAMDARAIAPERTIRVIGLDGGPARHAPVVGDEARLRQVVANLMTNALRYTPEGSPIEVGVGRSRIHGDRAGSVMRSSTTVPASRRTPPSQVLRALLPR